MVMEHGQVFEENSMIRFSLAKIWLALKRKNMFPLFTLFKSNRGQLRVAFLMSMLGELNFTLRYCNSSGN